jgi:cellulose synthase/poly-beta-1,6-N-acetylglucosamine synthase-like glycosyltransferase
MYYFFSISLFLLLYIYIYYPLFIWVLSKIFFKNIKILSEFEPSVTIIIPVKNEEFTIKEKLENCLYLDYPKNKLQILVIDSSSDDKTQDIVSKFFNM